MTELENRIRQRAFDILQNQVNGGNFWNDVSNGLKTFVPLYKPIAELVGGKKKKKPVKKPVKKLIISSVIPQNLDDIKNLEKDNGGSFLSSVGDEIGKFRNVLGLIGIGKKPETKPKRKLTQRNIIMSKLMKKGFSMAQASQCIKENNLV